MAELLRLSSVSAGYGQTQVLEEISLSLPEGGALAVLGRNGVGKTTLMATLMGLTRLHGGAIVFAGRPIALLAAHQRNALGLGYVPQTRDVFASLTVAENLSVAARPGEWTLPRVYDLFPQLAERKGQRSTQLSGGEQQMLAIGRALMGNPRLLLLDEPMEGLAPRLVGLLAEVFARLRRESGLAFILAEHQARLALSMTDHAVVLSRGCIIHSGDSRALLNAKEHLARLILDSAPA